MTELQKKEFDILKECIAICDDLHLTYYLVCGSALGVAKFDGFIPWDDDIDIGLPRGDYQIFIEKAQALLSDSLFLQNYMTDPRFPLFFSKVKSSNTTFIETPLSRLDLNHGVYIDVFPLDGYPEDSFEQEKIEVAKKNYSRNVSCVYYFEKSSVRSKIAKAVRCFFGKDKRTKNEVQKIEKIISQYNIADSQVICNHGNWQGKLEYSPKSQYGDGTWATFEGLKVRIPEKYDEYLTQKYGDWRADLPPEQQVGHHYAEVIDLNRPYTDYIVPLKNGKIRLKTSSELLKDGITPPENYKY